MSIEGEIFIKLHWDGQRIVRANLAPRHPVQVAGLLRGKSALQAAHTVPLLFSLCGKAQAAAAVTALEAAQNLVAGAAAAQWRELLVRGEALLELLWRFLLDLPRLIGAPSAAAQLTGLRKHFARLIAPVSGATAWKTPGAELPEPDGAAWHAFSGAAEAVISAQILGMPAADWVEVMARGQLLQWLNATDTPTTRLLLELQDCKESWGDGGIALMPEASRERVLNELLPALESDPDYTVRPHWLGQIMETGPLARLRDDPLLVWLQRRDGATVLVRLLARLVELVQLGNSLQATIDEPRRWVQGAAPRAGVGLAWVQTARGLLLHQAELDENGTVLDYRIVAPTEWNFHPAGPCAAGLAGLRAASVAEAHRHAELMVQALDPCVAYQIEVEHA